MNKGGPKKAAYNKAYNARPEQVEKRVQRNQARKAYEAKHGDLPGTTDVDHKRMIKDGGTNSPTNPRAVPEKTNVGRRKGKQGYK